MSDPKQTNEASASEGAETQNEEQTDLISEVEILDEDIAVEENDLSSQLAEAESQSAKYRDEALRIRAEMENLRKRSLRDIDQARKFALERFMGDLLEVSDSLDRGLDAAEAETVSIDLLKEGTQLTQKLLKQALSKHGLTELDPVGEKFNPEQHEAMSMIPSDQHEPDTVVQVIQKGYVLNDRLLRPARVLVAKSM